MTIEEILKNSTIKDVETEILLSAVLNEDRSYIKSFPEKGLTNVQESKMLKFIEKRDFGEPIPYILGYKEFYGLKFLVNQNVLIPRPETEEIIDKVMMYHKNLRFEPLILVDVGTGSGCIAVTLAVKNSNLKVVATDISPEALDVAQKNAKLHKVSNRIEFIQSDLLEKVNEKVDIIVSNLPYIPTKNWVKLPNGIKNFEPRLALDSGKTAMILYSKLFKQAKTKLNTTGQLFYEIDGDISQVSVVDLVETPLG